MQLFHFSDNPNIEVFVPRPVRIAAERPIGLEWLNGPLVWAIQDSYEAMYLFPRECPRILLWRTPKTTEEDYQLWWKGSTAKFLVYIEEAWLTQVSTATLYRYNLPTEAFVSLDDAGMWVAKTEVTPIGLDTLTQLPKEHQKSHIEVRTLENLLPLKGVWKTSLHASGIRLRNAQKW